MGMDRVIPPRNRCSAAAAAEMASCHADMGESAMEAAKPWVESSKSGMHPFVHREVMVREAGMPAVVKTMIAVPPPAVVPAIVRIEAGIVIETEAVIRIRADTPGRVGAICGDLARLDGIGSTAGHHE